jgi:uncharacterized membrane protein
MTMTSKWLPWYLANETPCITGELYVPPSVNGLPRAFLTCVITLVAQETLKKVAILTPKLNKASSPNHVGRVRLQTTCPRQAQTVANLSINSHPVHPATVHFPIAFLSLAAGLDILYGVTTQFKVPYLIQTFGSNLGDISKASYGLYALGLITAIPAVLSGAQQLLLMTSKGGWTEEDGKTIRPKVLVTLTHAVGNDISLALAAYCWWGRSKEPGYAPTNMHVLFSAVILPVLYVHLLHSRWSYSCTLCR